MFDNILEFFTGFSDIIFPNKIDNASIETQIEEHPKFYLGELSKKFIYRPQYLNEYIGQERAKELVSLNIQKIETIKPCHFLISGFAGCGKTTLAYIIASHLKFQLHSYIGGAFTMEALHDFLIANEEGTGHILFIDETHNLDKKIAEFMYPIIEDYTIGSKQTKLKPFIMIGATTEKSTLLKKFKPLVDRCGCQIELEQYQSQDMKQILMQYNNQIYKENIKDEVFEVLSKNCRFTPRIAIALFDDYLVCKNTDQVLKAHRIIRDSLTDIDIRILTHLMEINKPVGEEALSIIGGCERADFKCFIEPFLIKQNLLTRTSRGRLLTPRAKLLLEELK